MSQEIPLKMDVHATHEEPVVATISRTRRRVAAAAMGSTSTLLKDAEFRWAGPHQRSISPRHRPRSRNGRAGHRAGRNRSLIKADSKPPHKKPHGSPPIRLAGSPSRKAGALNGGCAEPSVLEAHRSPSRAVLSREVLCAGLSNEKAHHSESIAKYVRIRDVGR
jgi:hypothetical protein